MQHRKVNKKKFNIVAGNPVTKSDEGWERLRNKRDFAKRPFANRTDAAIRTGATREISQ